MIKANNNIRLPFQTIELYACIKHSQLFGAACEQKGIIMIQQLMVKVLK